MLRGNREQRSNREYWGTAPTMISNRDQVGCLVLFRNRGPGVGKTYLRFCEKGSSEISCKNKCGGTSSLVINTIYDSIEGDNVTPLVCTATSMLIKSNLLLACWRLS